MFKQARLEVRIKNGRKLFTPKEEIIIAIEVTNLSAESINIPVELSQQPGWLRLALEDKTESLEQTYSFENDTLLEPSQMMDLPAYSTMFYPLNLSKAFSLKSGKYVLNAAVPSVKKIKTEAFEFTICKLNGLTSQLLQTDSDQEILDYQRINGIYNFGNESVYFEQSFIQSLDRDLELLPRNDSVIFSVDASLNSVIPVKSLNKNSLNWKLSYSDSELFALPAAASEEVDVSRIKYTSENKTLLSPAVESNDNTLTLYAVRYSSESLQLIRYKFEKPNVAVEEATGKDDWDDEYLVPGKTSKKVVAMLSPEIEDITLMHSKKIRGIGYTKDHQLVACKFKGKQSDHSPILDFDGDMVKEITPFHLYISDDDEKLIYLLKKKTPKGLYELSFLVVTFEKSVKIKRRIIRLGEFHTPPKYGVISQSVLKKEKQYFCCAFVNKDSLYIVDSDGMVKNAILENLPVKPLQLLVTKDFKYMCVHPEHQDLPVELELLS